MLLREANYQEWLFLEAWLSTKDRNAENNHMAIPEVYKSLMHIYVLQYIWSLCVTF